MSSYSMDLRERIVAACQSGSSQAVVADRFGVCRKTVQRYMRRASQGELAPRPIPGRPPRLAPEQDAALMALVQEKSDWTLEQLSQEWQQRTGVLLPCSTLHGHLTRLGARYKKRVASPKNAAK